MKIGIIGTGAWGSALANVLTDNGNEVILYGIVAEEINDINTNHKNSKYLKSTCLNVSIKATDKLIEAVKDSEMIILAVPSQLIVEMANTVISNLNTKPVLVNVSKGFEPKSHLTLLTAIRNSIDISKIKGLVSLIGPSFANEVAVRDITTVCAVSRDIEIGQIVQKVFSNSYFRVYLNTDEIGCEIGAAIKNVIAIASGMCVGLGYGDNTKAAVITRGLAEIIRVGVALGADKSTFTGLTGIGDLFLTCSSNNSRNFTAGYQIGKDNSSLNFWKDNKKTVEGVWACQYLIELAHNKKVEVPITRSVHNVLFNNAKPSEELFLLVSRALKEE
ncbi:MAG: NAD(P)-dependent glycerol-3-phosphate dehydrogenase [Bacillales bacterium]|jgi:glycerol-3-phosphate dehydrogenase (NAD(P)+)|nr:NAD(P)-dependent glycerol-3-phosphate dehydrogenase [Bacillales bacterium]